MHDILTTAESSAFIEKIRANGVKTVVFTNGCFDILHRGHVELLEQARAHGDFLILGLNSDASVRRLKGPERPLVNEKDRAFVLSRLEAVDAVCLFEEDTPLNLIKNIKPDVLIKGGDYTIETIVGHEIVQAYGGRVMTIPLISGRSTTIILNKIKQQSER